MHRALVFAGQGSHKIGMGLEAVAQSAKAARVWHTCEERMKDRYGISVTECVRDNPTSIGGFEGCSSIQNLPRFDDVVPPPPESRPRPHLFTSEGGVLGLTQIAQPSIVLAQLAMLEAIADKHSGFMDSISLVAGHSLGEMTSLAAIGVFPPEVAVELVYRRGLHMQSAVQLSSRPSDTSMMYAVNPTRAKLKDVLPTEGSNEDDLLAYLVELVALKVRKTTSWVEIVNYNVDQDQTVVAGDGIALSILGKCLDPQLRATAIEVGSASSIKEIVAWCAQSVYDDCKKNENYGVNDEPLPDYIPGSFHRARRGDVFSRKLLTMDDGLTLPLERLTRLTLEGGGQSGLKKKSWYVPLPVSIPFHSSHLRRAADSFHADCLDALPSGALLEGKLLGSRSWVTNLTGTRFAIDAKYQQELLDAINGENIGEYRHSGQHESQLSSLARNSLQRLESDKQDGLRHIVAITCAAQIAHAVQWSDTMNVISGRCKEVVEVSPTKTLCNMFKRSHDDLLLRSLPFDERLLFQ